MLLLLAKGLFTKKRTSVVVEISFFALSILSCVFLYFFNSDSIVKIVISAVLFTGWLLLCYKASWKKAVFAVLFWLAYLTIGDSVLLTMISALMGKSQFELMQAPSSYYFFCFSIKTAEILGIVVVHTWQKSHFTNAKITLSDWLRVVIFPAAMLMVSVIL